VHYAKKSSAARGAHVPHAPTDKDTNVPARNRERADVRSSIKTGVNAINEVAVTLRDNFGALFINNVEVQGFRGQPPTGGGAVGLHAESEADAWLSV